MKEQLNLTASLHIDAAVAPQEGEKPHNRRFNMTAYTGTSMVVAGWRYPVVVDLAGMSLGDKSRPIFVSHNQDIDDLLGQTDKIEVAEGTLVAAGEVLGESPRVQRVISMADKGFRWQASIGARIEQTEFIKEGQVVTVNGKEFAGPMNVARKSALGEISFVPLGADSNTSATIAANKHEESNMNGNENQNQDIQAQQTVTDPAKELRAQAAAESKRIAAIRKLTNGKFADIEAKAIEEGWDETRTELEVLRASRPSAPPVTGDRKEVGPKVLEAAALLTGGIPGDNLLADFGEQAVEAADKRFRGGIGLQELLLEAAWANGYSGRNFRDSREVLRFAFDRNLQAGFSSIDIGGILSNVANKFLLEGFFSVEGTWRNICAIRNVSDFKTVTSYRLIGTDQYESVAPGGEIKHGTLGEESYTNKADTFGLMLSIDRRDIINDDLGAIELPHFFVPVVVRGFSTLTLLS